MNLGLEKLTLLLFLSPSNSHRAPPPRDQRVQGSPQGSDLIVCFGNSHQKFIFAWLLFPSQSPGSTRGDRLLDLVQNRILSTECPRRCLRVTPHPRERSATCGSSLLCPYLLYCKLQRLALSSGLLLLSLWNFDRTSVPSRTSRMCFSLPSQVTGIRAGSLVGTSKYSGPHSP